MWQFWPKIDQENCDGECVQHTIIPLMLTLRYIQCLMAKTEETYWATHPNNFYF